MGRTEQRKEDLIQKAGDADTGAGDARTGGGRCSYRRRDMLIQEAENAALNGAGANNRTIAIQYVRVPGYGACYGTVIHSAAVLNFQKNFPDRRMCGSDWARLFDKCPAEGLIDLCNGVATSD